MSNCCLHETLFGGTTCGFKRHGAVNYALSSRVGKNKRRFRKTEAWIRHWLCDGGGNSREGLRGRARARTVVTVAVWTTGFRGLRLAVIGREEVGRHECEAPSGETRGRKGWARGTTGQSEETCCRQPSEEEGRQALVGGLLQERAAAGQRFGTVAEEDKERGGTAGWCASVGGPSS